MTIPVFFFMLLSQAVFALDSASIYHSDRSKHANSLALASLNDAEADQFALGRSFFHIPWVEAPSSTTARDGLGPLFNANSCASCHPNNGGGSTIEDQQTLHRSIVIKLTQQADPQRGFSGDLVYGRQININGTQSVPFEAKAVNHSRQNSFNYPDGRIVNLAAPEIHLTKLNYGALQQSVLKIPLRAPVLIGLGMLEQIPEQQILQAEDIDDRDGDGISGSANRVWSLQNQQYQLGRFGWKAAIPSVIEQVAHALNDDMGLTSQWFPRDNCGTKQAACLQAYQDADVDVPQLRLQAMAFYLKHLGIAKPAQADTAQGEQLFNQLGCSGCHSNQYRLNNGTEIKAYSDLLLHDMGPALAAALPQFEASAQEWRTAPLWGLGLHKIFNPNAGYLHDGRAASIEQAILWHGGEAQASMLAFSRLQADQRDILLNFLETL